eukprot:jgi/Picre1/34731/NNA_002197.t1
MKEQARRLGLEDTGAGHTRTRRVGAGFPWARQGRGATGDVRSSRTEENNARQGSKPFNVLATWNITTAANKRGELNWRFKARRFGVVGLQEHQVEEDSFPLAFSHYNVIQRYKTGPGVRGVALVTHRSLPTTELREVYAHPNIIWAQVHQLMPVTCTSPLYMYQENI